MKRLFVVATLLATCSGALSQSIAPPSFEVVTRETSLGDWTVGSRTQVFGGSDKSLESCFLSNVSLRLDQAQGGLDEVKFTFYPSRWRTHSDRVSVILWRAGRMSRDVTANVDAGGKVYTLKGYYDADVRTQHAMGVDEANQILKAVGEVKANRRVQIYGGAVNFTPSLDRFDEALTLLKTCVEKLD